jgi:hypothetical protein
MINYCLGSASKPLSVLSCRGMRIHARKKEQLGARRPFLFTSFHDGGKPCLALRLSTWWVLSCLAFSYARPWLGERPPLGRAAAQLAGLGESLASLHGVLAAQPQRHPLPRGQAGFAADVVALWSARLALPRRAPGEFVAPGGAAPAFWVDCPMGLRV